MFHSSNRPVRALSNSNRTVNTESLPNENETVTGRKARDLQMGEIGYKCQTLFYLSLKQQEETNYKCQIFFSFSAKSLQSCPTLCDPIDGSPPGSAVPGILQARTLERVAISFSSAWKWKVKVKSLSHVWLFATPWTEAYQAPPSMGFSRQEYWSGLPLPKGGLS